MNTLQVKVWIPTLLVTTCILGGCGTAKEPAANTPGHEASTAPATPVTLTIALPSANFSPEEIKKYVIDPVAKKHPHIKIETVNTTDKGFTLPELVAAGKIPDIVGGQQENMSPVFTLGISSDITELVKKVKLDLNRIQSGLIDGNKAELGWTALPGLPLFETNWALAYNKSFFDRFGVAYPKDGMMWEDVGELAKKLTRVEAGVQYWGLSMARTYTDQHKQVSLPFADFTTNKPLMQSQGYKDLFALAKNLHQANGSPPLLSDTDWNKQFDLGQVGMKTASAGTFQTMLANKDLNFDVVTYPQMKSFPGVAMEQNAHWWYITQQSKNKEAALQVLDVILSNDIQTALTRGLRLTVLNNASIQSQVGADVAGVQGKNVQAYAKLKSPKGFYKADLQSASSTIRRQAYEDVLYQGKDINTALREADEKLNAALQERLRR